MPRLIGSLNQSRIENPSEQPNENVLLSQFAVTPHPALRKNVLCPTANKHGSPVTSVPFGSVSLRLNEVDFFPLSQFLHKELAFALAVEATFCLKLLTEL